MPYFIARITDSFQNCFFHDKEQTNNMLKNAFLIENLVKETQVKTEAGTKFSELAFLKHDFSDTEPLDTSTEQIEHSDASEGSPAAVPSVFSDSVTKPTTTTTVSPYQPISTNDFYQRIQSQAISNFLFMVHQQQQASALLGPHRPQGVAMSTAGYNHVNTIKGRKPF